MNWDAAIAAFKDVGIVLGTISAALLFTRTYWMPWFRVWNEGRKARAAMPATLTSLVNDFGTFRANVEHELYPNSSSSLRDAVDRTERTARETNDRVHMVVGMIRHTADANRAEATFETDSLGQVVWVNTTMLRWTGLQLDAIAGWGWINAVAFNDRDRLRDEIEAAIEERRAYTAVFRLIDADGHIVRVELKANPIRDASGHVVKWMGHLARLPA